MYIVTTSVALAAIVTGLAFGLSLIVAVGPQNAYVLQQGIRRQHVLLIVVVCAISDILLIAVGVGGAGAALDGRAWLIRTSTGIGVAFLLGYGIVAARRAMRPRPVDTQAHRTSTWRAALAACLAFTWLNPGVYIDTVVLVGPVSHAHGDANWWFGVGAMVASSLWFTAVGFGAARFEPLFRSPRAWRVLDASVAVVMLLTAARTALSL